MNSTLRPYRLLAPGPVPVPSQVMLAMGEKVLHHRTPQFAQILGQVWADLKTVFATEQPVQLITGTGSAAMEAAVVNTLKTGDQALVVVSGKFGERWAEMCERYSVETIRWNIPWGAHLDIQGFSEQLKKNPGIKVVFTQVCETSTATLHPIEKMAQLVRQVLPNAIFAVDAITAAGCMPLPMDKWGIDVMVAGSQKALMIPTGLSFIALSERAWKAQSTSTSGKFYFDLAKERSANAKGDSQFSVPTPLVVGLAVVLNQLKSSGGLERMWKRCECLASVTREVGVELGLGVYSESPSPSVTALTTPSDSTVIRDWLETERNITIMGGQDQLKGKIIRVGHMGDVRDEDMLALFEALAEKLGQQSKWVAIQSSIAKQLKTAVPLFP